MLPNVNAFEPHENVRLINAKAMKGSECVAHSRSPTELYRV